MSKLLTNTTNLQSILEAVNNLPEAGSEVTDNAVLYTTQILTEDQKAQARANIGIEGTGKDGESITVVRVEKSNEDGGENIIHFSDGSSVIITNGHTGEQGNDGTSGNGIKSAVLNADYTLTLTFDDGTTYTTPNLRGAVGDTGNDGAAGKDGVSVTHSWNGTTLTITSASGTSSANLVGDKGDDGTSVTVKSVSESSADGGSNIVTFSDGKTVTIKNGGKGSDGDTGARGVGIFTIGIAPVLNPDGEYYEVEDGDIDIPTEYGRPTAGDLIVSTRDYSLYKVDHIVPPICMLTLVGNIKGAKGDSGDVGQRGTGVLNATSGISSYTTSVGGVTPAYRVLLSTLKSQAKVSEVYVGDIVRYSYYLYPVIYVDGEYVYLGTRTSIRGATGAAGTTPVKGTDYFTAEDKTDMVNQVKAALPTITLTGTDKNDVVHTWTLYGVEA